MNIALEQILGKRVCSFFVWKLLLCTFPLIAGCAALPPKPIVVRTVIIQPVASYENVATINFSLIGRISVRDENQRFSGGVRWQHSEIDDKISLLSPLGQIMVQIEQDHEGARLTTSDQKVYSAADVESLTEEVLAWRIPLAGLKYWVQGQHSPTTVARKEIGIDGRTVTIHQDGWKIDYISFFPTQSALPRGLQLNYEALTLKLVVDNWEVE